jgi:hypothetical protein
MSTTGSHDVLPTLRRMLRFKITIAGVLFAIGVTWAATVFDVNVINVDLRYIVSGIEQNELDEVATVWVLAVVAGALEFRSRRRASTRLAVDQLRVLRTTMRTVQDIVGNSLNELQLLRFEAEGLVPAEALSTFDESIRRTMAQLAAVADLEAFAELPMACGPGLDLGDRLLAA